MYCHPLMDLFFHFVVLSKHKGILEQVKTQFISVEKNTRTLIHYLIFYSLYTVNIKLIPFSPISKQ